MLKKGCFIPLCILTLCYRENTHILETGIKEFVSYLSMTDHQWEKNPYKKTFLVEKNALLCWL